LSPFQPQFWVEQWHLQKDKHQTKQWRWRGRILFCFAPVIDGYRITPVLVVRTCCAEYTGSKTLFRPVLSSPAHVPASLATLLWTKSKSKWFDLYAVNSH
jgi:hypothetical protein